MYTMYINILRDTYSFIHLPVCKLHVSRGSVFINIQSKVLCQCPFQCIIHRILGTSDSQYTIRKSIMNTNETALATPYQIATRDQYDFM